MSRRTIKELLPILILIIFLFMAYLELRSNMQQLKTEYFEDQHSETLKIGQEPPNFEEADKLPRKDIDSTKTQTDENEQKVSKDLWRAIERKDSFNNELQYYSKANVVINGAAVNITSKKENIENKMYTSGLVESINAYRYGFFEFTISISEGKGIFPAIWFLRDNGEALPEIDLFEMIGSEPYIFYGVNHFLDNGVQDSVFLEYEVQKKEQYTVALEWRPESLDWYVDNKKIYSTTRGVPQDYMFIIVNQAIGGDWPGNPDNSIFPVHFKVLSANIEPVFVKGRN